MALIDAHEPRTFSFTVPGFKLGRRGLIVLLLIVAVAAIAIAARIITDNRLKEFWAEDAQLIVNQYSDRGLVLVSLEPITYREYVRYTKGLGYTERTVNETLEYASFFRKEYGNVRYYIAYFNDENGDIIEVSVYCGDSSKGRIVH